MVAVEPLEVLFDKFSFLLLNLHSNDLFTSWLLPSQVVQDVPLEVLLAVFGTFVRSQLLVFMISPPANDTVRSNHCEIIIRNHVPCLKSSIFINLSQVPRLLNLFFLSRAFK